ncbi:putative receptor-like protein kinase At1g30570 [Nicotiana tabacum]|uniref:non-specific serine/threonine protein kinase n=2 Tax=Nicotiana tabacum TaxID=4097 RepID=A0A1S3YSK8_TOBAC|nr:PREDICTED: probable receptor-like protein kinase At1g30570 [Nicotiana tabacum]XP_016455207.1 PREDICTED: probable receptor-like protein kinase At1g30570 [Nicotiana tabacum]
MKVKGREVFGQFLVLILVVFVEIGEAQTKTSLVNCGTNSTVNVDGSKWVGDSSHDNNVTLSSPGIEATTASFNGDSSYEPLYKTARFFDESVNYTFQIAPGSYFLRLHFYPFSFGNHDANESYFAVAANGLKLVSEFNVAAEIVHKNLYLQGSGGNSSVFSLVKEYFVTSDINVFVLEFIPNKGSFGFVNAIEIIPVTDKLFVDSISKVGGNGANSSLNLSKRGIQTMYRLNVGGSAIKSNRDSGLRRMWEADSSYMIIADAGAEAKNHSNITYASPNDTSIAPLLVYETARIMSNTDVMEKRLNMSWKLEVDPDFDYLVRLHFCEFDYNKPNQRIFKIYINNKTAADNYDIFSRAGGMNKAYHEDYFDVMPSKSTSFWVQLGPDTTTGSAGTDALLNGLEVFKLSRNGNLAYVQKYEDVPEKTTSKNLILWVGIGAGIATIAIVAGLIMLIIRLCRRQRSKDDTKKSEAGWRPLFLHGAAVTSTGNGNGNGKGSVQYQSLGTLRSGRRFTLAEIKTATNNFDESLVIGVGGFGKVFKAELDDGTLGAIKRANPQSQQGLKEFETEIEMLSKLRHRHLVSMIGFCDEQNEMILVYEYMANGTLRSHLFGSDLPSLSWKQRLEVCIGSARGLHYLHTGSERGIIHRDVKTTNILLDENLVAKMADFGLSKTGPSLEHTHVSTAVKGSFGYLDPEYFRRQQLTEKSDVYSFGVVLFEVVCARPVINPSLPRDQINLAEWAMRFQRQRKLETIVDPQLAGNYSPESLMKFGEIAEKCLADEGKSRPTMGEVLWHLEYVLQLHEAWLRTNAGEDSASDIRALETVEERGTENSEDETHVDSKTKQEEAESATDAMASGLDDFSQFVNQNGR